MTHSCDHRLIDNARGAQFLKYLKDEIEYPILTLLQVGCSLDFKRNWIIGMMEYWSTMFEQGKSFSLLHLFLPLEHLNHAYLRKFLCHHNMISTL